MSKLAEALDAIRDSEAFQQVKGRYDELDSQAKLYVNLGAVALVVFFVFFTILLGMAKLSRMKSDINEREELIGYLQRSSDQIRQLKAQQSASRGVDTTSPLPEFVGNVLMAAKIAEDKAEIGQERTGAQDKETVEALLDVKLSQVNLRQITQFLFTLTEQGSARSLNIKDLTIDTKSDPSGWMDAAVTISSYRAK